MDQTHIINNKAKKRLKIKHWTQDAKYTGWVVEYTNDAREGERGVRRRTIVLKKKE